MSQWGLGVILEYYLRDLRDGTMNSLSPSSSTSSSDESSSSSSFSLSTSGSAVGGICLDLNVRPVEAVSASNFLTLALTRPCLPLPSKSRVHDSSSPCFLVPALSMIQLYGAFRTILHSIVKKPQPCASNSYGAVRRTRWLGRNVGCCDMLAFSWKVVYQPITITLHMCR